MHFVTEKKRSHVVSGLDQKVFANLEKLPRLEEKSKGGNIVEILSSNTEITILADADEFFIFGIDYCTKYTPVY